MRWKCRFEDGEKKKKKKKKREREMWSLNGHLSGVAPAEGAVLRGGSFTPFHKSVIHNEKLANIEHWLAEYSKYIKKN
jgi:hypothetical protein